MKSMGRSYLLMFLVFGVLSMMGVYDGVSFISFMMVMMLIMMPINTFAYDEQAKWDRYAVATPAGRRGVVKAKYLFTLLLLAVALVLILALQAGSFALEVHGGETLGEMVAAGGTVILLGTLSDKGMDLAGALSTAAWLLPVAACAGLLVSYLISRGIYEKKEL